MSKTGRYLFAFFLVVCFGQLSLYADDPSPEAVLTKSVAGAGRQTSGVDNAVQMAQEEVRDPFAKVEAPEPEVAPAATPTEIAPEIKVELQGIGLGNGEAYAVIGGEIFYQGDEKQGVKLLEVRKGEVDILMSGGKVTIPLFDDKDLKRATTRAEKKKTVGKTPGDQLTEMPSSLERKPPPL